MVLLLFIEDNPDDLFKWELESYKLNSHVKIVHVWKNIQNLLRNTMASKNCIANPCTISRIDADASKAVV
jgi:hypothetical protein